MKTKCVHKYVILRAFKLNNENERFDKVKTRALVMRLTNMDERASLESSRESLGGLLEDQPKAYSTRKSRNQQQDRCKPFTTT